MYMHRSLLSLSYSNVPTHILCSLHPCFFLGVTAFPKLDIAVKPKLGRAILWPSVLNSNPMEKEPRTENEVQDVIEGTMFGFNVRLHLHNYADAHKKGCN
jgi:hypothetical protein